jgi:hypothetical protein
MEDPPPKLLAWPAEEDVEVEYYTSSLPHETTTVSIRFVGRCLVGEVSETMQPAREFVWLRPETAARGEKQSSCRRSDYYTYLPLGLRIVKEGGRRL